MVPGGRIITLPQIIWAEPTFQIISKRLPSQLWVKGNSVAALRIRLFRSMLMILPELKQTAGIRMRTICALLHSR